MKLHAFLPLIALGALVACQDELATEPQAVAPESINASEAADAPPGGGISSICLASRKASVELSALADAEPNNAAVQAEYAAQREITADVCD